MCFIIIDSMLWQPGKALLMGIVLHYLIGITQNWHEQGPVGSSFHFMKRKRVLMNHIDFCNENTENIYSEMQ